MKKNKKSFVPLAKKVSTKVEKLTKQLQSLGKQTLEKVTQLGKNAGKSTMLFGKMAKSKWYYFALVIIIFIIVTPVLGAKNLLNINTLTQPKNAAVEEGPVLSLEDVDPSYKEHGLPGDLLSEGRAGALNSRETVAESVTKPDQTESAAKIVPKDELDQVYPQQTVAQVTGEEQERDSDAVGEQEAPEDEQQQQQQEQEAPEMKLGWPLKGEIVGDYGQMYFQAYGDYRFNPGVNLAGQAQAQVKAAAAGKVALVEEDKFLNKYLILEHPGDFTTLYANLNEVSVSQGDQVEAGAVLGRVGEPGFNSLGMGTNLFFQVKLNENTLDPKEYLQN